MSLLQQLGAASLAAHAAAANPSSEHQVAAQAACTEVLHKLAESLTSCKRSAKRRRGLCQESSPTDFVQAVQDGLHSTQQQLQRLLQQQGIHAAHHEQQQVDNSSYLSTTGDSPNHPSKPKPSLLVLQSLLQLAVGDVQLPSEGVPSKVPKTALQQQQPQHYARSIDNQTATSIGPDDPKKPRDAIGTCLTPPAAGLHRAARQQQACQAAYEALKLFDTHEIMQLPLHSLSQALLLQPTLLQQLLEALAAAVLQPVLPAAAAAAGGPSSMHKHGGSSSSSMQDSITHCLPCWKQLPAMLSVNPILFHQASTALCSWCEQAGHQRLWQLTTLLCRPAWQYLTAAAAAVATDHHPAATPAPKDPQLQQILAGSFQLLCPEPWQQQLVQVLVQQPDVDGLRQLLLLLPGCSSAVQRRGKASATPPCAAGNLDRVGNNTSSSSSCCWPSAEEWQQSCGWQTSAAQYSCSSESSKVSCMADDHSNQQLQQHDLLQVLSAWRLVTQHRCWSQFACYLLARTASSIMALQQQQQQGLQQSSLQQGQPDLEEQQRGLAKCAACFIAWVQEPVDRDRRNELQQLLLAPLSMKAPQQQQGCGRTIVSRYQSLMQCWQRAFSGGAGSSSSSRWAAVRHTDLPVALLQQQDLLAAADTQDLLQICALEVFDSNTAQQTDSSQAARVMQQTQRLQQNLGHQQMSNSDLRSLGSEHDLRSKVVALLDALDDASSAVVQLLQASMLCNAQIMPASSLLSQQQQQSLQQLLLDRCDHWLTQQWVMEVLSSSNSRDKPALGSSSRAAGTTEAERAAGMVQLAKKLLVAVTACDRELKSVKAMG